MSKIRAILYLLVAKHWVLTVSAEQPKLITKENESWYRSMNSVSLSSGAALTTLDKEREMKLIDIADMPGFNQASNTTGKEQRDISSGQVYEHPEWKAACRDHGAMNCVNEQRTIWRCLACNAGAYNAALDGEKE